MFNHPPLGRAGQDEMATDYCKLGRRLFILLIVFVMCFALIVPENVSAHAVIVSARPAMNSEVPQGEIELSLHFNSRIDAERSQLILQRPDGSRVSVPQGLATEPNVLKGNASVTMAGPWKLHWQVLSVDGHITRGEIVFSVRRGSSSPP
jgi:copper resistance protein C